MRTARWVTSERGGTPRGHADNPARYQITETEQVSRALDVAAWTWPGEPRARLLVRLLTVGSQALQDHDEQARRRASVRETSGAYDDVFDASCLDELRDDWPA